MFVADSGMNSEDNRSELSRACGKYLLACRMASVAEIKRDVLSKRGRYTTFKDNLQANEVIVGDDVRQKRYILCFNPKEAERHKKHRSDVEAFLEGELESHQSRLYPHRPRVDPPSAKYEGKWVLETNDDTISLEDTLL